MTKVFAMHEIELQPEVDPAEYERYFVEEVAPQPMLPGWKVQLLRGDRGPRAGKFLVLFEIEDVEARDRYFPSAGQESEEFTRFMNQNAQLAAAWEKSSTFESADVTTDYLLVGE